MGNARGYKSTTVIDFETTFGADPAAPAGLVMPINTNTLKGQKNKNRPATITGTRNPVAPFDGNLSVNGNIQVPVDASAFAYWLKACFGAPSTDGVGPYTHTFAPGDAQPSLVIENKLADASAAITYPHYNGVKVSSLGLSVGGDGELVADLGMIGANEAYNASPYDGSATAQTLDRFQQFQAALTEGGSALEIATAFQLNLDFGLDAGDDKRVIGSNGILGDIFEGIIGVSGSLTFLLQDTTLIDKAVNSTESGIVLTFTDGANVLTWTIEELQYSRNTPEINGPQGILVTLPFEGYYNDGSAGSAIQVELTNSDDGTDYA
jgi:hypothetical protein